MDAIGSTSRRRFLTGSGLAATGLAASGAAVALLHAGEARAAERVGEEKPVTANEDLMREHGVLRRALLIYRLGATKLRSGPETPSAEALNQTARLFRSFGEDYHERQLEEAYIFPAVRKAHSDHAKLVDILQAQHQRGREVTDYILSATENGHIGADVEHLAAAMDAMALMYEEHTAREDTVLFPAWKQALPARQYADMGEQFEEIEKRTFGHDGFDDAVERIAGVEQTLGLADLATFTAPPQPPPTPAAPARSGARSSWTDPDKAGAAGSSPAARPAPAGSPPPK
jgi:hemerythrin-like domain-containing protein